MKEKSFSRASRASYQRLARNAASGAALTIVSTLSLASAQASAQPNEADDAMDVIPWPESRSTESFDVLLDKVFEGEGGEGGWGIPNLESKVSFPALDKQELVTLFGGNSLIKDGSYAFYFHRDGRVEGYLNNESSLSGTWRVTNDQICIDIETDQLRIGCHRAVLVVDRVLLFRPTGEARFTGLIVPGRQADEESR